MTGTDELNIVVDFGSSSIKAGYAGDDVPMVVFPSCMSNTKTKGESIEWGDNSFTCPIQRGLVTDWDHVTKLWEKTFVELAVKETETVTVTLTESLKATTGDRAKWAEILFDTFHVPSICIGNTSSLAVFASGRTTGVAVECGAGLTSSVPVFEGLALTHAAVTMDYGGQDISAALRKALMDNGHSIDLNDAKSMKETHCLVDPHLTAHDEHEVPISHGHDESHGHDDMDTFLLPDGTEVILPRKLFSQCTSKLLNNPNVDTALSVGGIVKQTFESLSLCDDSIRRDLMGNILLAGGTSLLPGLGDRLQHDLTRIIANHNDPRQNFQHELKVFPSSYYREPGYTFQRKYAPWIGASIVGSLEEQSTMKITRQDWDEDAESFFWQTRCF